MVYYIFANPVILLLTLTVIITSLMFLFVGRKKKKPKKIEKVIETKQEKDDIETEKKETDDTNKKSQNKDDLIKKTEEYFEKVDEINTETNDKIKKNEKKVSQVYIRRKKEDNSLQNIENVEEKKYNDLSDRAEFVKTSKHISKLNGFSDQKIDEIVEDGIKDDLSENLINENKSRFDYSKRLSDSVKNEDFENLFVSHITERYMNINPDKHISQTIEDDIFKRTNELIMRGETRALDSKSQEAFNSLKTDKDKLRFWAENNYIRNNNWSNDEDVVQYSEIRNDTDVSLKNLIFAEALLKRKNFKK